MQMLLLTTQITELEHVIVVNSFAGMEPVYFDPMHLTWRILHLLVRQLFWLVHLFQVALLTNLFDVGMEVVLTAHAQLAVGLVQANDAKMELAEQKELVHNMLDVL